jgi:dTDP-4-dehydrorhamnose reductase
VSRWLVTGAGGMLGRDLLDVLGSADVTGLTRAELDITDPDATAAAVAGCDVVVNAAAWTDVDGAESAEDRALQVNGVGPANLAAACALSGARLVHVSTDYVFAGDATTPYGEDAAADPRSAYGRTKRTGEVAVLELLPESGYIVRTAWLYGEYGRNFAKTMIKLEAEKDTLDVVDDQRGQPTWSMDVARTIVALVDAVAAPGIYHATSTGETTWYGFARAVFEELGADPDRIRPTTTDRFPRPAPRPAYSVLGHARLDAAGVPAIQHWRDALAQAFPRLR